MIDLYAPTRDLPYWYTVTRDCDGGWAHSSEPVRDPRNGLTGNPCTLTQDEAMGLVRIANPLASIVVRGEATRATGYLSPAIARSEPETTQHCESCRRSVDIFDEPEALAIGGDSAPDSYFCTDTRACEARRS